MCICSKRVSEHILIYDVYLYDTYIIIVQYIICIYIYVYIYILYRINHYHITYRSELHSKKKKIIITVKTPSKDNCGRYIIANYVSKTLRCYHFACINNTVNIKDNYYSAHIRVDVWVFTINFASFPIFLL